MQTKCFTLILSLCSTFIFSQLKLEFKLIDSTAEITIYNESRDNYTFPIDRSHFRPYELDCYSFSDYEPEFPSFGLMVNVIKPNGNRENYVLGYNKDSNLEDIAKNVGIKRENLKQEILSWGNNNNLTDYNLAFINYSIMNNLVYLKSKEKITFKINFDLNNITDQDLIFYNYILENSNYKLYLTLCGLEEINKYLTSSQKKKLKKYKFLDKKINSNTIELKVRNNSPVK